MCRLARSSGCALGIAAQLYVQSVQRLGTSVRVLEEFVLSETGAYPASDMVMMGVIV